MPMRLALILILAAFALAAYAQDPDLPDQADPDVAGAAQASDAGSPDPQPPEEEPARAEPGDEPGHGEITGATEQRLIEATIGSSGSSHEESRSESSSSSVSFGADPAPAGDSLPAMPGSPGHFNVAAVAGRWALQMSGIECGVDLRDTKWAGDVYAIQPSDTCAPGVGPVRSWQPTPNGIGIRLNDGTGRSIGELWSYGPKRWKGKIGGEAAVLTR